MLWTAPEGPLPAGSIVPIYSRSEIQKSCIVGVPGLKGKDKDKKIELPLWQVEIYPTRGKAAARAKAIGSAMSEYLIAVKDGLPLRDKPSNLGKRVYRLRLGQIVKVLEKVEGEVVTSGNGPLPGSWYRVLVDDGSAGFAFSYAMKIYDESKEGPPVLSTEPQAVSGRVDLIFSKAWRPEYFQEMLDDGRVDLDYFSLRFGIFTDAIHKQVRVELPAVSQVYNYQDVAESGGIYSFSGTSLKIKIESDSLLVCYLTDEAASQAQEPSPRPATAEADSEGVSSFGSSGIAAFVVPALDPAEAIREETMRRQKLLETFIASAGADWAAASDSPDTGRLSITRGGRFSWKGRGDTAAALLPADATETGDIAFRLYLDPSLSSSWDGAFSLRFDPPQGGNSKSKWLDFLYRRSPAGLVLQSAGPVGESLTAQSASGSSSLVFAPPAE